MNTQEAKVFDLKERCLVFSKEMLGVLKSLKITLFNKNIVSQCIRSATSIGANYHEADCAESKKDFEHKIGICKKEAVETEYWLKLLIDEEATNNKLNKLLDESSQLKKIFISIINKSRAKNN